jgi:UDP:flavonoid glycosyltransferase YjiC (YdhE family)
MSLRKRTVLFFAECVTLAHMARPAVLAKSLDPAKYEVVFASNGAYDHLFGKLPFKRESIFSIDNEQFLRALAKGRPLYVEETLKNYVGEELALFERIKPDIVVGDFRLSLSISARVAKVPYVTISNIYWSPFARQRYPVPDLPITRTLGVPLAQVLFDIARPFAFALHTRPLNAVRKQFGLCPLGLDLRKTYTDADLTLYADLPALVKTEALPSNHRYIGPVLWSPDVPSPDWWDKIDLSKPIIYMTPGSSGDIDMLSQLAMELASLPATVLVATTGRHGQKIESPGVFTAEYLSGEQASRRADLVICNGGSPTTWQALAVGVPVVGLPINLDQYLNMQAVEDAGLGITVRRSALNTSSFRSAVQQLLEDPAYRSRAKTMQRRILAMQPDRQFEAELAGLSQGTA